jgi:hypothetical protein
MDGALSVPSLANHNWSQGFTVAVTFKVPLWLPRRVSLVSNGPAPHATFWVDLVPAGGVNASSLASLDVEMGISTHRLRGQAPEGLLTTSREAPIAFHAPNLPGDRWLFAALTFDPAQGGSFSALVGDNVAVENATTARFPEGMDRLSTPLGKPLVLGAATEEGLHSFCGAIHELLVGASLSWGGVWYVRAQLRLTVA